jgi:hypothetical protein
MTFFYYPLYLICKESEAVMKECDMEGHYSTRYFNMKVVEANWGKIK